MLLGLQERKAYKVIRLAGFHALILFFTVLSVFPITGSASACPEEAGSIKEWKNVYRDAKGDMFVSYEDIRTIHLAGGCFWGLEQLMQSISGVVRGVSGYANGDPGVIPNYEKICTGRTGYRETVRVEYRPEIVSLDAILFAFFSVIDPTVRNRQGNDMGSQYQTGIYYSDDESGKVAGRIAGIERSRHKSFHVEIKRLESFFEAEEYHQDYLDKNPGGYCHITPTEIERVRSMKVDPARYRRPSDADIEKKLSKEQYHVAVASGTEPPFKNEYWDLFEKGLYVDIISGEPLFASADKFKSTCGWPAFSKAIDPNTVVFLKDDSFGMRRTEVRSRTANTHLGHVFHGDPDSPNGVRFCINSASIRLIAYEDMDKEGYGYLKEYVR